MVKNNILYLIIIALIIFLFIREGCGSVIRNNLVKDISNYKTKVTHYKGLNDAEIAQNNALMLDNEQQLKAILNKNDTLTELMKAYNKLKNVTIVDSYMQIMNDSISYDTIRIPCDFEPFQISRDSLHYSFSGTIAPDYFKIDSIKIPDTQSLIFGKRKMGLFKSREWTVEVVHSNPLVHTTNIGQYSIMEKRNKITISLGVSYGLNLSTGTTQPVIGVNVGYPLISF